MWPRTFRFAVAAVALFTAAFFLNGCPNLLLPGDFLSADPYGNGRGTDFLDSPTEGAPTDDGDTGGGEREVTEPDVIRQIGDTLYVLNQYRGLSIIDLESETLLSQTPAAGYPRDLYISGDRAYVLVAYVTSTTIGGDAVQYGEIGSRLYVVDIANPAATAILGSFDLEGDLVDSRLVGDVLYAVSARYSYTWGPGEGDGGVVEGSPGTSVSKQQTSSSWVTSINVSNPEDVQIADELSFEGYGNVIQATSSAIFVAGHDWESDTATITYVDISDPSGTIAVRGNVNVPGHVADRFKMDVYQNVLRVVSNTSWPDRQTYVSTVPLENPDALAVLGQTTLPGAENETLFATRFDGPRAYAVTYLVVDPLFVLDLSDPANPKVAGELKVPGWSTHIEPQGDRLITLGVDDTDGGRRVSVSIFDVTDPAAPALNARESFGENWSWSSAYADVKSFTVLDDTIIVPFSGWNESGGYDRLQFLSYTADTLQARGHVDLRGQAVRSFEYADHYYGVTQEQLAIINGDNLDAPEVVGAITLAENVADFLPLNSETAAGVAVIRSYTDNSILLRAQSSDGTPLSEVELDGTYGDTVLGNGRVVALVSAVWEDDRAYTLVRTIDFSNPTAPETRDALKLDLRPVYSWWWYDMPVDAAEGGRAVADMMAPYYYGNPSSVVAGDYLVIHGQTNTGSWEITGPKALAVVNLDSGLAAGEVELDYGWVGRMLVDGNSVLIHSQEDGGRNLFGQGFTRHYVSRFNPASIQLGARANIPGEPIAYADGILTLDDWRYTPNFGAERLLRTARWDGGTGAQLVDTENLGASYSALTPGGGYVFSLGYDGAYKINAFAVADDGAISELESKPVSGWSNLLAADDDGTLYVYDNASLLTRFENPGTWTLRDTTELFQWPAGVRFSGDAAYLPLGYGGLVTLPR